MTLDRLTQITSVGITSGITLNNATLTGVTTIASLDSVSVGGTITAVNGTFSGNVSIAGTLTYEDVTNIDSVGLITARSGLNVTGGSVGIGTDNPTTRLEIAANNNSLAENNTLRFTDTDTSTEGNQQIGKIEFYSRDVSVPGAGVKAYIGAFAADTTPDAHLDFATQDGSGNANPVIRMRIKSDGNIGIGTDNPSAKVQITGSSGSRALTVNAPTLGPYITFETNGTAFADIGTEAGVVGSGTNDLLVLNARGARDLAFRTNYGERVRITSDGRIGINSTSPSAETMDIVGTAPKINIDSTNGSSGFRLNIIQSSSQLFRVQNAGTTAFEVNSNGNTLLANGNLVFSTSGTGIDFSATANGSGTTTSELLDDYEEGTWTPTLTGFTNAGSSTGRVRNYTRIGNVVTIWFDIFQNNNNMSFSNGATITGLPFSTTIPGGSDDFHTPVVLQYYRHPATLMVNVEAYVETTDTIILRPASANSDIRHLWGHVTYLTS